MYWRAQLWLVGDWLLPLLWQVSWWPWSICVWTDTTSASRRPRAAARPWRPPAPTWTPQAPWTLRLACSTAAQPTARASHEISISNRFSIVVCALLAWQHQAAAAPSLLYNGEDFSLCHWRAFFFLVCFSFFNTGSLQEKLFSGAVFVFCNLCIRHVMDLTRKQSSSGIFKMCAETLTLPPSLPQSNWCHDGVHLGTVWKWLHVSEYASM